MGADGLRFILDGAMISLVVADVCIKVLYFPKSVEWWSFFYGIVYVTLAVLIAGDALANRRWFQAAEFIFFAGLVFYFWWRDNNKRRKKLADKLAGRVAEIGGKLKVVHPVTQ